VQLHVPTLNEALLHVPQLETVALLQQKLQYEQQLDNQQQEIPALQTRLKDSTERASKLRQHFEK
jgi:flagellar motility protein MotE (MotC chaperone)